MNLLVEAPGYVMTDHWERLRDAVVVLAGGGPIKQRLADAYQAHLRELDPEELPRELRAAYLAVVAALQSAPRTGSLDVVSASVRKMSEADAAGHSQAVVRIFADLQEPTPQVRAGRLRAVPSEDENSAFLNRA
jgi:hypothetical protein